MPTESEYDNEIELIESYQEELIKERIKMINQTIRTLNGAVGRLTSLHGDSVPYLKSKIDSLEKVKLRLIKQGGEDVKKR